MQMLMSMLSFNLQQSRGQETSSDRSTHSLIQFRSCSPGVATMPRRLCSYSSIGLVSYRSKQRQLRLWLGWEMQAQVQLRSAARLQYL